MKRYEEMSFASHFNITIDSRWKRIFDKLTIKEIARLGK